MKFLNDISKKEKFSQTIIYVSVLGCFLFSIAMLLIYMNKAAEITNKAKDEVYIFVDNQAYKAVRSQDYGQNMDASAKGAIQLFNDYFWNLEPYQDYINVRQNKAFDMSDESTKRLRKSLINDNFYTDIINSKSSTKIELKPQDIVIDFSKKPYQFNYKAEFIVVAGKSKTIHNLEAGGELEQTRQVDNNFTGFRIKNYHLDKLGVKEEIKEAEITAENNNQENQQNNGL
ncbi:hypothetical protein SAMN05421768_1129 [Chryseobacterium joostei]|uniref:Conjugative transposon protein TraK n=2 Tax=Chryseobacterium joostei TaxID=112234 RepID=A0A1N7KG07_9FLAO|nr:hypothetical protein [Chryseobacterium joostei]SIS60497.1 hypothetical protein SAMN05421768_1129 [Chryseobacterium joostei]